MIPSIAEWIARYLKAENSGRYSEVKLLFEKVTPEQTFTVMEDQAVYEVKPAKKKLTYTERGAPLAPTPEQLCMVCN